MSHAWLERSLEIPSEISRMALMVQHEATRWIFESRCCSWLLGACGVNPQPNPPTLRAQTIMLLPAAVPDQVQMVGEPGSVAPPGAVVRVINLSRMATSADATSGLDGSFSVLIAGVPEERYRVQVLGPDDSSRPVNVQAPASGGPIAEIPRSLECLAVTPAEYVDFGDVSATDIGVATVTLVNGCGEDVFVDGAALLMGSVGVGVVTGTPPLMIAPNRTRNVVVTYAPVAPGEAVVDVIAVSVSVPAPATLYVSVFGHSVP